MNTWERHLMERPDPPKVDRDEPNEIEWEMINEICAYMHMCVGTHVHGYSRAPVLRCMGAREHARTFQ